MKTVIAAVAITLATPAFAGGIGGVRNVIINAGEIEQGMQDQERRDRGQYDQPPQQPMRSRIVCGPVTRVGDAVLSFSTQNCTEIFENGQQRNFTCTRDQSGGGRCN